MFDEGENFPALRQILHPFRVRLTRLVVRFSSRTFRYFSRFLMVLVTVEAGRKGFPRHARSSCLRDAHKHLHSLDTIHLLSLL
jgi:hypothetical protein